MCLGKSWGRVSVTHFLWTGTDLFSAGVTNSETKAGQWSDSCHVTENVQDKAQMGTSTSELPALLVIEQTSLSSGTTCPRAMWGQESQYLQRKIAWWYKKGNFLIFLSLRSALAANPCFNSGIIVKYTFEPPSSLGTAPGTFPGTFIWTYYCGHQLTLSFYPKSGSWLPRSPYNRYAEVWIPLQGPSKPKAWGDVCTWAPPEAAWRTSQPQLGNGAKRAQQSTRKNWAGSGDFG